MLALPRFNISHLVWFLFIISTLKIQRFSSIILCSITSWHLLSYLKYCSLLRNINNITLKYKLGAHAKFQNPTITPSGRISNELEREREEEEEKKMPFIVATYVYASSQGQRTHSARTNILMDIGSHSEPPRIVSN